MNRRPSSASPSISTARDSDGRQLEASSTSAQISLGLEDADLAGADVGGADVELDLAPTCCRSLEIDQFDEQVAQRIGVAGIQLIGRQHAGHEVEGLIGRRMIEIVLAEQAVERRRLDKIV